jgi:hypothetical protein
MPQGFAKKIEINLLLADLALQLSDLRRAAVSSSGASCHERARALNASALRGRPVRRSPSSPPSWYL